MLGVMRSHSLRFQDQVVCNCLNCTCQEVSNDDHFTKYLQITDRQYAILMVYDMFFAGIDTTSTTVALLLHQLAINPVQQAKLIDEVF